jgi:hypothetical protein
MILSACVLVFCATAQAQPLLNVHQQKPTMVTATAPTNAAVNSDAKASNGQIAAMFAQGKIQCPAGVHYFVGYNPCIPPSPWNQQR